MEFANKTVLITGAAVGIGRAAAIQFAKEGANVGLLDANTEKLESVKTELAAYEDRIEVLPCDVSDQEAVDGAVEALKQKFGKIDILINNAALWRCWAPFWETSVEEWKRYMDVNVMGVVYCTKAVIRDMIQKQYGRVISVASVAGVYGNANMAHYSATKGAVISFTKALAKEVAAYGITVNAISPGSVSPSDNPDIDHVESSQLSFMGRTGSDRENADLICFLASDKAAYISGQNIQIDGCRKKQ